VRAPGFISGWLVALIGAVLAASPSLAENNAPRPPRPFQEKGGEPTPWEGPFLGITPQQRTEEIEKWAREHEQTVLERCSFVRFFYPADAKEFAVFARYSLLVLTVQAQKPEELPLKRVYLRTPEREIALLKLSSWRTNVDQKLLGYRGCGPYRENGFYLYPFSAIMRVGQIQADFTHRLSHPVLDLPAYQIPDWLKGIQSPDPEPDAWPDPKALDLFIKRNTPGWPPINTVPEVAVPKPQAGEPKAPSAGLRDLFRK
jgi:hypothetical protein